MRYYFYLFLDLRIFFKCPGSIFNRVKLDTKRAICDKVKNNEIRMKWSRRHVEDLGGSMHMTYPTIL